jgi:hypothetical protein
MGTAARWVVTVATLTALACGSTPHLETRTFELRHIDGGTAETILSPYVYADRPGAAGRISVTRTIVTVRETPDNLERIARVLAQYDRPQPSVRLTFKIIEADGVATRDTSIADLEAALRGLFRFRGYRLVTEAVLTGAQGAEATQPLSGPGARYVLATRIHRVGSSDSATVDLWVRLDVRDQAGVGRFETEVRLPIGKTAVLGSVRADAQQPTTILAVQPELVVN